MKDLIRRDDDHTTPLSICKTELAPVNPADKPSGWRSFVNSVREAIGLKPVELALRFADAEATS